MYHESSVQDMHHQPGIDWTKAARLAMGRNSEAFQMGKEPFDEYGCNPVPLSAIYLNVPDEATIKYPPIIGQRLNRNPNRDSFLRGGQQFRVVQHNGETRARGLETLSLSAKIYGSLKRTFSKKSRAQINADISMKYPTRSKPHLSDLYTAEDFTDTGSCLEPHAMPNESRASLQDLYAGQGSDAFDQSSVDKDDTYSSRQLYSFESKRSQAQQRGTISVHSLSGEQGVINPWETSRCYSSVEHGVSFQNNTAESQIDVDYRSYKKNISPHPDERRSPGDSTIPATSLDEPANPDYEAQNCSRPAVSQAAGKLTVSRVELQDNCDESAVCVEHPNASNLTSAGHCSDSTQSTASADMAKTKRESHTTMKSDSRRTRTQIHEVLQKRRCRIASAALRDTTLNNWSSDESSALEEDKFQLDVFDTPNFARIESQPITDSSSTTNSRPVLGDLEINNFNHGRQAQVEPKKHKSETHVHRQYSTKAHVQHRAPALSIQTKEQRVFSSQIRGPGMVRSCIQGFEDKIKENGVRGTRRRSGPYSSGKDSVSVLDESGRNVPICLSKAVEDRFGPVRPAEGGLGVYHDVRFNHAPREDL